MTLANRLMNLSNRAVLGVLLGVAMATSGGSLVVNLLMNQGTNPVWWEGWLQNFSTEMFGAFLTFLLLELIVASRDRRSQLIRQMGSTDNGLALQAVRELQAAQWLFDGALQRASLVAANLQEAPLYNARLQEASLNFANLQEARLSEANLQGANLSEANLQETYLTSANLQGAHMIFANLQGAHLNEANLQGASLSYANLQGAHLDGANLQGAHLPTDGFDENTILPNDTYWTPDTDMARFTDSEHPEFWRSDDPDSPAYRGDNNDEDDD